MPHDRRDPAPASAHPNGPDSVDRAILDIIQSGFPLEQRPYAAIGKTVGVSEEEALARVRRMRERGLIRRIGANFQSRKLGFHSTLCAAVVAPELLDIFTAAVNAEPGVTHNYLRDHHYNVWFTVIAPSKEAALAILDRLTAQTGVPILNLPAKTVYKIKVDFSMSESDGKNA